MLSLVQAAEEEEAAEQLLLVLVIYGIANFSCCVEKVHVHV